MKKLSIEQKAKAYDEVIKKVNDYYEGKAKLYSNVDKTLDYLFPELKEDEDEKIKKWLIGFFNQYKIDGFPEFSTGMKVDSIIAWLEKQEKLKPISAPHWMIGFLDEQRKRLGHSLDYDERKEIEGKLIVIRGWLKKLGDANKEYCKGYREGKKEILDKYSELEKQVEQASDKVIEEEKPLLEKFKQAVYDCAWGKVTCKKEGETKEEYANRWAEHFLFIVKDWADDYIDFTVQQKLRNSYEKGKTDEIEKQSEKKEINLGEILKHYTRETELYSPLYGKLWLAEVDDKTEIITCYKHPLNEGCTRAILEQEDTVSFYSNGTTVLPDYTISKDCMLFLYDIEKQCEQKTVDEIAKEICKDKASAVDFLKSAGIMDEEGKLAKEYRSEDLDKVSINNGRIEKYNVNVELEHKTYSAIYNILSAVANKNTKLLNYYLSDYYIKNSQIDWKIIADEFWNGKDKSIVN